MFNIITACSRPKNLARIRQSIEDANYVLPCKWTIVHDSTSPIKTFNEDWIFETHIRGGISGDNQKNKGIELAGYDDILYILDDDTILHKDIWKAVSSIVSSKYIACVFHQVLNDGYIRVVNENEIRVYHIDQGQIVFKKSAVGNLIIPPVYEGDGLFIESLYKRNQDRFTFVYEPLCYYNYLRK